MSSVNLSEVVAKLAEIGMPEAEIREVIEPLGLDIIDFDEGDAFAAGLLRSVTKRAGLSLGDRACLAAGMRVGHPVLTADGGWVGLDLGPGVQVTMVR